MQMTHWNLDSFTRRSASIFFWLAETSFTSVRSSTSSSLWKAGGGDEPNTQVSSPRELGRLASVLMDLDACDAEDRRAFEAEVAPPAGVERLRLRVGGGAMGTGDEDVRLSRLSSLVRSTTLLLSRLDDRRRADGGFANEGMAASGSKESELRPGALVMDGGQNGKGCWLLP